MDDTEDDTEIVEVVTALFKCEAVEKNGSGHAVVRMRPDYPSDSDDPENHPNKQFWDATPSGELTMYVTNPTAIDLFEPGTVYKLSFEPHR